MSSVPIIIVLSMYARLYSGHTQFIQPVYFISKQTQRYNVLLAYIKDHDKTEYLIFSSVYWKLYNLHVVQAKCSCLKNIKNVFSPHLIVKCLSKLYGQTFD